MADRLIVEARKCLARQKEHIVDLEQRGQDARTATALLGLLEESLHLMQSHRATILEKLAGCAEPKTGAAPSRDGP
jgi:hypothetical protein